MSTEHAYYEDPRNVAGYSQFNPEHDGTLLVDALQAYLDPGATVLGSQGAPATAGPDAEGATPESSDICDTESFPQAGAEL